MKPGQFLVGTVQHDANDAFVFWMAVDGNIHPVAAYATEAEADVAVQTIHDFLYAAASTNQASKDSNNPVQDTEAATAFAQVSGLLGEMKAKSTAPLEPFSDDQLQDIKASFAKPRSLTALLGNGMSEGRLTPMKLPQKGKGKKGGKGR